MTLQLHYFHMSPPSVGIKLILHTLGLPHETKSIDLEKGCHKSPEYLKINPDGKVPAITEGDFNLQESRAIAMYLVDKYGEKYGKSHLYPKDPKKRAVVNMTLNKETILTEKILFNLNIDGVLEGQSLTLDKLPELKELLKAFDSMVSKSKYMAGDEVTIADFSCLVNLTNVYLVDFEGMKEELPNLFRWLDAMKEFIGGFYEESVGNLVQGFTAFFKAASEENAKKNKKK